MKHVLTLLVALTALFAAPRLAEAGVIFDSGVDASDIVFALPSGPPGHFWSTYAGDDFTLTTPVRVNSIQWTGVYAFIPSSADDFTLALYDDSPSFPGTTPSFTQALGNQVNRTMTKQHYLGFDIFSYSATLTNPLVLQPGHYLLSIVNDVSFPVLSWAWTMGPSFRDDVFVRTETNPNWIAGDYGKMDFTLRGRPVTLVPEPASFALLVLGMTMLLGYGYFRVRRRKLAGHGLTIGLS